MNIVRLVARLLLGLIFTIFGLNGFLQFIPVPPYTGLANDFIGVLDASHYMVPVFAIQVGCGLLFLVNRYVPLALALIAPVIVNMVLFHLLMAPGTILPAGIAAVCWAVLFYGNRRAFAGILGQQPPPPAAEARSWPMSAPSNH